jgi:flagellin
MTLSVLYNSPAGITLSNLETVNAGMSQSIQRLSSGVTIATAADGPGAMVQTNHLRQDIAALQTATSNSQNGISLLQTAGGSMQQIATTLNTLRDLALQAANSGVQTPDSLLALQQELDQGVASITQAANGCQFASLNLLQGGLDGNTLSAAATSVLTGISQDATRLPGGIAAGSTVTASAATPTTLSHTTVQVTLSGSSSPLPGSTLIQGLSQDGTTLDTAAGGSATITGPLGFATITVTPTTTIDDVVAQINAYTGSTGLRAAYDPTSGVLDMASTAYGASTVAVQSTTMSSSGPVGLLQSDTTPSPPPPAPPTVNSFITPAADQTLTLSYTDAAGTARTLTLTQDPTSPGGLTFTNATGGPEAVAPFTAFDPGAFSVTVADTSGGALGGQITIPTGNYAATRTTSSNLQIGGSSSTTVPLDIPDCRAGALGHSAGLASQGWASLQDLVTGQALVHGNATQALQVVDAAIGEMATAAGAVGALQSDALTPAMHSLQTSVANMTSSASTISDTDFASASALFSQQQIIYQAATAMLAQANHIPSTIMQMLTASSGA